MSESLIPHDVRREPKLRALGGPNPAASLHSRMASRRQRTWESEFCPRGPPRDHRGSHLTTDDVLRNDTVVEPDGPVTFDDGYGQGVTVRFDITELIMRRHGEDPYRVEKNWFLDGTSEFRQELFECWQEKQTLVAVHKLRIRLLRIAEDETLPDREKAARIITIFRDTADNESGASARTTIAEFVAERMPDIELPTGAP